MDEGHKDKGVLKEYEVTCFTRFHEVLEDVQSQLSVPLYGQVLYRGHAKAW